MPQKPIDISAAARLSGELGCPLLRDVDWSGDRQAACDPSSAARLQDHRKTVFSSSKACPVALRRLAPCVDPLRTLVRWRILQQELGDPRTYVAVADVATPILFEVYKAVLAGRRVLYDSNASIMLSLPRRSQVVDGQEVVMDVTLIWRRLASLWRSLSMWHWRRLPQVLVAFFRRAGSHEPPWRGFAWVISHLQRDQAELPALAHPVCGGFRPCRSPLGGGLDVGGGDAHGVRGRPRGGRPPGGRGVRCA